MTIVIGADACKDRLVYCVLDSDNMPSLREHYLDGSNFHDAYTSKHGLNEILATGADVIALEPTGVNYTKFWFRKLTEAGMKVALIGHSQLRMYRKNLGLPDKDDPADALACGAYYIEHQGSPDRFVRLRDELTSNLRETALRLQHLTRLQSPAINRLQQDLAYAFPERANTGINANLFWRWLAGNARSARYDRELSESIGSGITADMKFEARLLCQLQLEQQRIENELRGILDAPQFLPYRQVMKKYGIGEKVQAILISQIYPIENFLDENRQPIVLISKGKRSSRPTAKHISLRKVYKMLGIAPTREQSGKSPTATKKSGSQLCRNGLWQWLFTRIECGKTRLKSPLGNEIYGIFYQYKTHKPIKLARAKTIAKVVSMMFYDLVDAIHN